MSADVVISGAGPNGLMLACELALAGVRPIVFDAQPGPSDEQKANGLVGQVVRQLDMRGLYATFSGDPNPPQPSYGWRFAGLPLSFIEVEGNPMYSLLLQQPRLVRLLVERAESLGVDVRWGHELTDVTPHDTGVHLALQTVEGEHRLNTAWLVGADGGHSVVRKSTGIGFPGHRSPVTSRVAHVHLAPEMVVADRGYDVPDYGLIPFGHTRFETGGLVLFPIEPDRPLLGTVEYDGGRANDDPMTIDELRDSVRRLVGVDVPFEAPAMPGSHALRRLAGINSRQAETYRAGRVLLLGDAAHVHSPMGGPGLNLGMQDAVNLGWKLAAVIAGTAAEALLDTYTSERHPVGRRVMMHSLAQLALAAPGPEVSALRELFAELADDVTVSTRLAGLLAGSDVRYDVGDDHVLSGRMVPDLRFDDGRRIADLLHAARPVLLDLTGYLDVTHPGVDVVRGTVADRPAAALLIRPDGYVAWAADVVDDPAVAGLHDALSRWCGVRSGSLAPQP